MSERAANRAKTWRDGQCPVCARPDCSDLEAAVSSGQSKRAVSRTSGIKLNTLCKHFIVCVPMREAAAKADDTQLPPCPTSARGIVQGLVEVLWRQMQRGVASKNLDEAYRWARLLSSTCSSVAALAPSIDEYRRMKPEEVAADFEARAAELRRKAADERAERQSLT